MEFNRRAGSSKNTFARNNCNAGVKFNCRSYRNERAVGVYGSRARPPPLRPIPISDPVPEIDAEVEVAFAPDATRLPAPGIDAAPECSSGAPAASPVAVSEPLPDMAAAERAAFCPVAT